MNCHHALQFCEVSKCYEGDGRNRAVDDVTLSVPAGQFCVLLGASGAGKSTLLKMVNGLVTPTAGTVHFEGVEVRRETLRQIRRRTGMIHQSFYLVPRLGVLDN